jgi:hypothetical protein
MTDPTRFPLAWPTGRPRRKASARRRGTFSMAAEGAKTKPVGLSQACARLQDQIERLGGIYPVLSTNVELRLDGRPRADRGAPADPAAAVYFHLKSEPYAMACDTYTEVAQNIAALAAHIEATRRIERYGVATAAETLRAFSALPPPPGESVITMPQAKPARAWWEFFGVMREVADVETIQTLYRAKARKTAPSELLELNLARDAALAEIYTRTRSPA